MSSEDSKAEMVESVPKRVFQSYTFSRKTINGEVVEKQKRGVKQIDDKWYYLGDDNNWNLSTKEDILETLKTMKAIDKVNTSDLQSNNSECEQIIAPSNNIESKKGLVEAPTRNNQVPCPMCFLNSIFT